MFEAAADCSSCRTGFAKGIVGVSELSVGKENRNSGCCDAERSWERLRLCFQPCRVRRAGGWTEAGRAGLCRAALE